MPSSGFSSGGGEITELRRQVRFVLWAHNWHKEQAEKVGEYVADFVYFNKEGEQIIEDYKGGITDLASWKIRHMAAQGQPVKIVTNKRG